MNRRPTGAQPTAASADRSFTQKARAAAGTLPSGPRRQARTSDDPPRQAGDGSAADAEHLDAFRGRLEAGAEAFGADFGVAVFTLAPVGGEEGEQVVVGGAGAEAVAERGAGVGEEAGVEAAVGGEAGLWRSRRRRGG